MPTATIRRLRAAMGITLRGALSGVALAAGTLSGWTGMMVLVTIGSCMRSTGEPNSTEGARWASYQGACVPRISRRADHQSRGHDHQHECGDRAEPVIPLMQEHA